MVDLTIVYSDPLQPLQKKGSEATFLKRGHRAEKCGLSPIWP